MDVWDGKIRFFYHQLLICVAPVSGTDIPQQRGGPGLYLSLSRWCSPSRASARRGKTKRTLLTDSPCAGSGFNGLILFFLFVWNWNNENMFSCFKKYFLKNLFLVEGKMFLRDYDWKKMSLWNRNRGTELEQYQTKRHCVFLKKLKITGLLGDFGSPSVGNQHVSVAKKIKNFELVPTPTSFVRSTASSKMEYSGKTLPFSFFDKRLKYPSLPLSLISSSRQQH